MWQGRRVVLGVTGGIAAYKSVELARELARQGALVDVVMSRGAMDFVGTATFEGVTHRPVHTSVWERNRALDHIVLARACDLVIVAPATANLLARARAGVADDLLTTLLLATTAPVVIAPAMNDSMYAHAAVQENLDVLTGRGWRVVGPAIGALAEGPSDRPGRMAEPADIIAMGYRALYARLPWSTLRVLVTAGPTREPVDPVRLITNRSSGKMGYRLAEEAWARGAGVTLISGPVSEREPFGVERIPVQTVAEMHDAVRRQLPQCDVLVMAAAPADFRAATVSTHKTPRLDGARTLELVPTDDILADTIALRPAGATIVGFALETGDAIARGRSKLDRKQLDLVVINDAEQPGAGFDVDTNAVTILDRRGAEEHIPLQSKRDVAARILDAVERFRG